MGFNYGCDKVLSKQLTSTCMYSYILLSGWIKVTTGAVYVYFLAVECNELGR